MVAKLVKVGPSPDFCSLTDLFVLCWVSMTSKFGLVGHDTKMVEMEATVLEDTLAPNGCWDSSKNAKLGELCFAFVIQHSYSQAWNISALSTAGPNWDLSWSQFDKAQGVNYTLPSPRPSFQGKIEERHMDD